MYTLAWEPFRGAGTLPGGQVIPAGKPIASGGTDGTIQVWDAADGGHVFTYRGHSDVVETLAWSPDGRRIASGSDDTTVQVWVA